MKKLLIICAISSMALISCAQSVNLLATKVSAPAGSIFQVGSNGYLVPINAPTDNQIYLLTAKAGMLSYMPLSVAAASVGAGSPGPAGPTGLQGLKGDKGDTGIQGVTGLQGVAGLTGLQGAKGDKGDTGLQGATGQQGIAGLNGPAGSQGAPGVSGTATLPAAVEGDILAYINGKWVANAATYNIASSGLQGLTLDTTLVRVQATRGGQYSIGGYVYIRNGTGTVSLNYTYTDNSGVVQRGRLGDVAAGVSQFAEIIVNTKAGTLIIVNTVMNGFNSYDAGANVHEK